MYLSPVPGPGPVPRRPADGMVAIGGPEASAALKRDAIDAARYYRKQGRSQALRVVPPIFAACRGVAKAGEGRHGGYCTSTR